MKPAPNPRDLGTIASDPVSVNETVAQPLPKLTVLPSVSDPDVQPSHPCAILAMPGEPWSDCFAVVDKGVFDKVKGFKWHGSRTGKLYRWVKNKEALVAAPGIPLRRAIWLHRSVIRCPKDKFVRFLSRDERDCRTGNLAIVATKAEAKQ